MTNLAFLSPARAPRRRLAARAASVAALLVASLACAAPAGAFVTTVKSPLGSPKVGVQSRVQGLLFDGGIVVNPLDEFAEYKPTASYTNVAGNPVVHGSDIYAIYWDPTNDYYHGDWQKLIDRFLHDTAAASGTSASVFSVASQYTDTTNTPASNLETYRGSYTDTTPYPASGCTDPNPLAEAKRHLIKALGCITDAQIQAQLQSFITAHGLPTGMGAIYYVLTPPGLTVCLDAGGLTGHCSDFAVTEEEQESEEFISYDHSFCSYHSYINPEGVTTANPATILYGVVPWTAGGLADGQLAAVDQTNADDCQDGGFNPGSKPPEQYEKAHQLNQKEQEALKEASLEEKEKIREQEAREGPHPEEPNQVKCPSPDGFCDTGLADLIINQVAEEQVNIITNPLLDGWQDSAGNENTDECRNFFAPILGGSANASEETDAGTLYNQSLAGDPYYVNDAFNKAALLLNYPGVPCLTGTNLVPSFSMPSVVKTGDIVGFDGMESQITLDETVNYNTTTGSPEPNYARFSWNFGDGSPEYTGFAPGAPVCESPWEPECAASIFHSYTWGGEYPVTLTVTDVGGNKESITRILTVEGPKKPAAGSTGGSSGSTGSSGSGTPTTKLVPAPSAYATIVSRTLRNVAAKGLAIHYSVSEQVAGHFEVLLSSAVAHSLGIEGPAATGLPAGSPPMSVIGRAILITTRGGSSTVHLKFSKRTAGRLAHARRVSLMLVLTVRNAAATNTATTTVISTAALVH